MAHELRMTLLGDCRIELDGELIAGLALAKARALLCYLAVTGRPQSRTAVTDLLWGEMNEADARRNLRVVLTGLRNAAGAYVIATRSDLTFNCSLAHAIDATTFEREVQARLASPSEPSPDDLAEMERLFALYQGDFMLGLDVRNAPAFEEWLRTQREHLRRLALQLGEHLANHCEAAGRDGAGIAVCRRLIELDSLQEATHRRLMRMLARSGQPAAALQQFERCRHVLAGELGVAPDATTLALAERIRRDMRERDAHAVLDMTSAQALHNLPVPTTPFVGRAEELAQIASLLADPACRLLTLIGIGGVGKTRLALQVAHTLVAGRHATESDSAFRHGVYFVPLAPINTADQMIAAIASAMRFTFSGQQEIKAQLLNHLRVRDVLLVLDNFEHLAREAPLLTEVLQAAGGVKLLVTSRERLDLYEEWLFDVGGLSFPSADATSDAASATEGDDALSKYSAVQLFAQRARRLSSRFNPANELQVVAGICRLMEGLPLGIELAAGWVRTHTCDEIARAIQRHLDFLSTSAQNVPERHRSLRVAFDYSWDMLTEEEAHKLAGLAVFRDGFDDAAARAVAGATRADLDRLADKSLLQRTSDGRWHVHEMLRRYLAGRLTPAQWAGVQAAHGRFYAEFVAQRAQAKETSAEPQALGELREEIGNVRAAWAWLIEQIGSSRGDGQTTEIVAHLNLCAPMLAYFYIRECWYEEGWRIFADARQAMRDAGWGALVRNDERERVAQRKSAMLTSATLAMIESLLAEFAFSLSRYGEVVELIEQALPVLRLAGDRAEIADALVRLGKAQVRMGHYDAAEPALRESLNMYQAGGDRKGSAAALNWLAAWHSNQGRFDEAQAYFEACLAIFREHGYVRGIANTLNNLGSNYGRNDRFTEEQPLYEEAHQRALDIGEPILIAVTLSNMAANARSRGDFEQSRRQYERSLAYCHAMGERRWMAANLNGLGLTLLDMGEIEAAWDQFQDGLGIAREIQSTPDMLDALAGLGEALAKQGRFETAQTVLDFVVRHPVTHRMARERSRRVLADRPNRSTGEAATMHVTPLELDDVLALVTPTEGRAR